MPESGTVIQASGTGVRCMWRDRVLGRYLRGEIGRDEAIADVGLDWVEVAERQRRAMREDVAWAMQSPDGSGLAEDVYTPEDGRRFSDRA